jgi:DNA invertase Pin-like site-specific DNA recombinase
VRKPKDAVDIRVKADYFPPGWKEPLLKKGETTWIAGRDAAAIALSLARAGYVRRIGRGPGREKGHGPEFFAIVEQLRSGVAQCKIAKAFNVTSQWIWRVKKKAEQEGLLNEEKAMGGGA